MSQSEAIKSALGFLDCIWRCPNPTDAALLRGVDHLLHAYHITPEGGSVPDDLDPPRQDWKAVQAEVAKRFADYGFYPMVSPLGFEAQIDLLTGDAIDDIADIAQDMASVVWYADNANIEAADACFRENYFHWGAHARDLGGYLFARVARV